MSYTIVDLSNLVALLLTGYEKDWYDNRRFASQKHLRIGLRIFIFCYKLRTPNC